MDALRTISTGFENAQQNARVAQATAPLRERDDAQPQSLRPEQLGVPPSVQVNISEAARAAARSGSPSSPPTAPVNAPAAPVQAPEAAARAGSLEKTDRVERQDAAAASQQAVQRYMENANNRLPAGQSAPSSVRVSA